MFECRPHTDFACGLEMGLECPRRCERNCGLRCLPVHFEAAEKMTMVLSAIPVSSR